MRSTLSLAMMLALPLACVTDTEPSASLPQDRGEHKSTQSTVNWSISGVAAPPAKPDELRLLKVIGHADSVTVASLFDAGSRLLTGSADTSLRLWDAGAGRELVRFKGHIQAVIAVAAAGDGKVFASSGKDNVIRLWDASSGKVRGQMSGTARALAFSADASLLAAGLDDRTVRVFDVETGALKATLTGHQRAVVRLAFHPTNDTLVSADEGGSLISWNAGSGQRLIVGAALGGAARSLAFDRTGARLVATTANRKAWIVDAISLQATAGLDLPSEAGVAIFSRLGDFLIVAGGSKLFEPDPQAEDYAVRLFSLANGRVTAVLAGHTAPVLAMAQAENESDAIVTASADETVRYWPAPAIISASAAMNH